MRYFEIRRFDGGYVDDDSLGIGLENPNMIRYGRNIRTRSGRVVQRDGRSIYCDFSAIVGMIGQTVQHMYEYRREYGTGQIYRAIIFTTSGDELYYVEPSVNPDLIVLISNTPNSDDIYCVNAFDHLMIADGGTPKTWDGNNYYDLGITPPNAISMSQAGVALPASYRKYKYSWYRSANPYEKESETYGDPTDASGGYEVDLNSGRIVTLTFTVPTDPQVTHYRLYSTETYANPLLPESDYFLRTTQAIGAGNTWSMDENNTLSLPAEDTTDRSPPPDLKYFLWDGAWLFGAGDPDNPSIIYYAEVGKPWYWPINNWDEISRDDGDVITGLGTIGATRYIFKNNSIWQWTGDPTVATPIKAVVTPDASMNMTRLEVGLKDSRSLAAWGNSLIFRAPDEHVYMLTNSSITNLSEYIVNDIKSLADNAKAVIIDDYYIIAGTNEALVCDLRRGKFGWEHWDTDISVNGWCVDVDGRCLGSSGKYIKWYYNPNVDKDEGEDFTKVFQPAFTTVGRAMTDGIFREVIAECEERDCDFTMGIYNEHGVMAVPPVVAYANTDRLWTLPRGYRGRFMSPRYTWTGNAIINNSTCGWLLGRRH